MPATNSKKRLIIKEIEKANDSDLLELIYTLLLAERAQ